MTKTVALHSSIAFVNNLCWNTDSLSDCSAMSIVKKKERKNIKKIMLLPKLFLEIVACGVQTCVSFLVCALGWNACLLCLAGPATRPNPDEDSDQQVVWGGSAGALGLWGWWWWSRTSVTRLFYLFVMPPVKVESFLLRDGDNGETKKDSQIHEARHLLSFFFFSSFITVIHWYVAPVSLCVVGSFYLWR